MIITQSSLDIVITMFKVDDYSRKQMQERWKEPLIALDEEEETSKVSTSSQSQQADHSSAGNNRNIDLRLYALFHQQAPPP